MTMRYCTLALVFQSLALAFAITALCLYGYRYHYDRVWYVTVADKQHREFYPVLEDLFSKSSLHWIEVYPGWVWEHHAPRRLPYSKSIELFLRWPTPQTTIVLVVLIFLVLAETIPLIITCTQKCNYCTPPCREKGFWHLLVGIVVVIAGMIDTLTYLQIQNFYKSFRDQKTSGIRGYLTIASCYGDLEGANIAARDEAKACPLFICFVCGVVSVFTMLAAFFCFAATIALCIAWRRAINDNDGVTPTESGDVEEDE